ncbi:hypothetical protein MASR1M74_14890 [Lentimicrobium sp.]
MIKMRKLLTLLIVAVMMIGNTYAQFVSYGFTASNGTYTAITGGTMLGTATSDDQRYVDPSDPTGSSTATGIGLPIGFNFVFNGATFDRFAVNTNGWISLGQSSSTPAVDISPTSSYNPLTSTTTYSNPLLRNRIAGFARDLQSRTGGEIRYETIGTAPNRVCVIQWKDYKRYGSSYTDEFLNFQIRLNETTNMVDIVFGNVVGNASSGTAQVGLGGTNGTEFLNRTSTTGWYTTIAGSTNGATMTYSDVLVPASGLTWTFGAMLPLAANYVSPANGAAGMPTNTTLNWTPNTTGGGAPTGYRVYMGTDNPPTNVANGVDVGNVLSYTAPGPLSVGTQYFWTIVPYNAVGQATGNATYSFTTTLGVGTLQGFTTNGFGIPLAGVNVSITNGVSTYSTVSGPDGAYEIALVTASPYTLTATLAGYNTTVMEIEVAPATTTYVNVEMRRPSMAVTPNPYNVSVNPNEMLNGAMNVLNNGDGQLTWTASINYTSPGPNTWLSLGSTTGVVPAYSNYDLPVEFNASGLSSGAVKTAEITFTSSPNVGTIVIPVSMTVSGTPLSAPTDLTAVLSNPITGTVALSWNFTPSGSFQYFIIKRNGVQVGTTTNTTYTNTLPVYGVYSYTVQAAFNEGNSAPAGPVTIEWANPTLVLNPTSLYNEQYPNSSEPVIFRISNTGEGTLSYSFPEYAARQLVNSPGFTPNVRSNVEHVLVAKGEADPTDGQGNRNLRGAGGPDQFGYFWMDSDETGGPAYVWNDISATGTLVTGLTDDNVVGPFPLDLTSRFMKTPMQPSA